MAYFVYILFSNAKDRYYVGQTDDIKNRMAHHISGKSPYTSMASDWLVVYTEEYDTRTESRKREMEIRGFLYLKHQACKPRIIKNWRFNKVDAD